MALYTIVQDGVVVNVIEADEAYIHSEHQNDIVILGDYPLGFIYADGQIKPSNSIDIEQSAIVPTVGYVPPVIRNITVAAFRARMNVSERHAIRESEDIYVQDIWEDLFARQYVDLDSTTLAQGIGYVLNYLNNVPDFQSLEGEVMTVTDTAARLMEVLVDGTEEERYRGVL